MKEIHIDTVDHVPRPIIAAGNTFPAGHVIAPHQHRRAQLISGATGVIVLSTDIGTWVMPPQRGLWIPPATVHEVRIVGAVSMQSLYLVPEVVEDMPTHCQVVGISPFMRSLMTEALELPPDYDLDGRAGALMGLLHHELRRLPALPLSLPYPTHAGLAARCRKFVERPSVHETIDQWSDMLGMSRRAFTRFFRRETGMSFVGWRQQACLISALPRLAAGESVTTVAGNLGYDNPAAFTTMFKRIFGTPPRTYLKLAADP